MLYLVDYPPRYINWAAPTIDILFVCGLSSDVYQLGRSDDLYFSFGLPSDN